MSHRVVALLTMLAILILVNWAIVSKELQRANGSVVYLELAPFAGRTLQDHDSKPLPLKMVDELTQALTEAEDPSGLPAMQRASDGYMVVHRDVWKIGSFKGLYPGQSLGEGDLLMRYRIRAGEVWLTSNRLQERHLKGLYATAKYVQLRVNDDGEALLAGLFDEELNELEANDQNS